MRKIRPYRLIDAENNRELGYRFWCPACKALHAFCVHAALPTKADGSRTNVHEFTGSDELPTFTPALLYTHRRGQWLDTLPHEHPWSREIWIPYGDLVVDCHLTVTGGRIYYHGDCPHEFKGETIAMVDYPDSPQDQELYSMLAPEFFR